MSQPDNLSQATPSGAGPSSVSVKRRKYVSRACEQCRHRRAKCDAKHPSCSPCLDRALECQYSTASDRRKPASRSYVELLRGRIDLLEQVLRDHSIDVDAAIAQFAMKKSLACVSGIDSSTASSDFRELCAAFEGVLSLDGSLNYDQDGEVRYFGPTSGCMRLQGPQEARCDNATSNCTLNSRYFSSTLDLETLAGVTDDLRAHLIDLYFTWHHPWCPIVDEALFKKALQDKGRYCNPLLINCILAAGSRYSDRIDIRSVQEDPNTAGKMFLERAELLLQNDMKCPNLTTVQALSILVSVYCGTGVDAAAWLHQGMANRLALDLGLNLEVSSLPGSGLISPEELKLRRQMYWTLYCDDKLHAIYSGRVCSMLDMQGSVDVPSLLESDVELHSHSPRSRQTISLLRAHITLSQILEEIILGLYAPKPMYKGVQKDPFFESCLLKLNTWMYDLVSELSLEFHGRPSTFPQAYTLHMVYYTSLILLGNSIIASAPRDRSTDSQTSIVTRKAHKTCHDAAKGICLTAKKYREVFGSFRKSPLSATHCLLSASLVLIQVASFEQAVPSRKGATGAFSNCLESLEELSVSWTPAGRIHRDLLRLKAEKLGQGNGASQHTQNALHTEAFRTTDSSATQNTESQGSFELPANEWLSRTNAPVPPSIDSHPIFTNYGQYDGYHLLGLRMDSLDTAVLDPSFWTDFNLDSTSDPYL